MKKTVILLIVMLSAFPMNAQTNSVNLELLGSSGMAGVNFDSRFRGNNGFGCSIGVGYGLSYSSSVWSLTEGRDGVSHQLGIPVELNYLFGKGNNHLVLGAGGYAGFWKDKAIDKPLFGYTFFGDIAYRHQKPHGFSFAAGLKPNISGQIVWPYLSFGYSF